MHAFMWFVIDVMEKVNSVNVLCAEQKLETKKLE